MNEHLENIKKFLEGQNDPVMERFRTERNRRLAETDWWVLPDRTPTQAQLDYRQALRDLPETTDPYVDEHSNIVNVTWPEVPE